MRALALALLLAGCAAGPHACPKPAAAARPEACPKPPAPDECVAAWYARADTPQCVDDWIDALADHRNSKKGKRK